MASKKIKNVTINDSIILNDSDDDQFDLIKLLKTPKSFYTKSPDTLKSHKRLQSESTASKDFYIPKNEIKIQTRPNEYYEGEVDENYTMSGWGKYQYACGDVYEGIFKDGMRHGYGEYVYKKGGKYVGEWIQDKKNGKGLFKFDSTDVEGIWQNDQFIKGCKCEIHQFDKNSFYQSESFLGEEDFNERSKNFNEDSLDEEKGRELLKKYKIHIDMVQINTNENGHLVQGDTFTYKNKPENENPNLL